MTSMVIEGQVALRHQGAGVEVGAEAVASGLVLQNLPVGEYVRSRGSMIF